MPHSERKVVDGVINRAKKSTHHDNVYAAMSVLSDAIHSTE